METRLRVQYPYMTTSVHQHICQSVTAFTERTFAEACNNASSARPLDFPDLAPEIRAKIFELALAPADGLPVRIAGFWPCKGCKQAYRHQVSAYRRHYSEHAKPRPHISRVCKDWRDEALPTFYRDIEFAVCVSRKTVVPVPLLPPWNTRGFAALRRFLQAIAPADAAMIKKLTIHSDDATDEPTLRAQVRVPHEWTFVHVPGVETA